MLIDTGVQTDSYSYFFFHSIAIDLENEAVTDSLGLRSTEPFSLGLATIETMLFSSEVTGAEAKPPLFELLYTVTTAL